jgi:hypothetical protein
MMRAPMSRMDVLTDVEIAEINAKSKLVKKYAEAIDRESAYEMLTQKIEAANQQAEVEAEAETKQEERKSNEPSTAEVIGKSVTKVVTSATFIRGVFGILNKLFRK